MIAQTTDTQFSAGQNKSVHVFAPVQNLHRHVHKHAHLCFVLSYYISIPFNYSLVQIHVKQGYFFFYRHITKTHKTVTAITHRRAVSSMIVGAAELVNNVCLCCARCGGTEAEQVELNRLLCGPQGYGFVLGPKALHCHTKQGHNINRF